MIGLFTAIRELRQAIQRATAAFAEAAARLERELHDEPVIVDQSPENRLEAKGNGRKGRGERERNACLDASMP